MKSVFRFRLDTSVVKRVGESVLKKPGLPAAKERLKRIEKPGIRAIVGPTKKIQEKTNQ